jgi:hypothetical protein
LQVRLPWMLELVFGRNYGHRELFLIKVVFEVREAIRPQKSKT